MRRHRFKTPRIRYHGEIGQRAKEVISEYLPEDTNEDPVKKNYLSGRIRFACYFMDKIRLFYIGMQVEPNGSMIQGEEVCQMTW